MFKKVLVFSVFLASFLNSKIVLAEDLANVSYTGIYTTSNKFVNFNRNKKEIGEYTKKYLAERKNELPFNLIFNTDIEERKEEINTDYYSLAFLITRDDFSSEKFEMPESNISISRNTLNIGITAILYQVIYNDKKKKNVIVYSIPKTAYSLNIKGKENINENEIDKLVLQMTKNLIEEELFNKIKKIALQKISGQIINIDKEKVTINLGSYEGIIDGQIIDFGNNIKESIKNIEKNQSVIIFNSTPDLKLGQKFSITTLKGKSEETYQITSSKISSNKVKNLFNEIELSEQLNQWLSDFLSDKTGLVILPPKNHNNWFDKSNQINRAIFIKEDQEEVFDIPEPKYHIETDITGFSTKVIETNEVAINDNIIFKVWLELKIPEKNYKKEFSIDTTKNVIKGIQVFEEKTQAFELLHQLTAKIAKEF